MSTIAQNKMIPHDANLLVNGKGVSNFVIDAN